PLTVFGRSLPLLVGLARPDQVHVGAEILPVLAGAIAGAVGSEAEVLGGDLVGLGVRPRGEVPALEPYGAYRKVAVGVSPVLLPVGRLAEGRPDVPPVPP